MAPKLLLVPLLSLSILFAQPQEAGASGPAGHFDVNGNRVAEEGPDGYMVAIGSILAGTLSGFLVPSTIVNSVRYGKDPAKQRTIIPYIGAITGGLTIGLGAWLFASGVRNDVHWGYPPVLAAGIASTAIGIHSIRRIKKARAVKKVTFHGITPTLLGRNGVEGMGFNVSLGW